MNGNSTNRIRGKNGVIIDSEAYLELPKAKSKLTPEVKRDGMIRYNKDWRSFEGALLFDDGKVEYRRFAQLDEDGRLMTSHLPDFVTSGMKYTGTFSPVVDDIDPPRAVGVYDNLPKSDKTNTGDYYIVRGLYNYAYKHYQANKPTKSPVIFTPTNESGQGDWTEIKYTFLVEGDNVAITAYARLLPNKFPAGHEGIKQLATDKNLTDAFNDDDVRLLQDGDWIISTGTKWQQLKQSRISITAGAVFYDRTFMYSMNRPVEDAQSGTLQDILDSALMYTLRRSGDSMIDTGSSGEGRLALVYGSASKPAITFNNNIFDPSKNNGLNPEFWSDEKTGMFHPADGNIGFTNLGTEKLRLSPNALFLYQSTNDIKTNPTIQLQSSTNKNGNIGISGLNDSLSFTLNKIITADFKDTLTNFHTNTTIDKNLVVKGTSTLEKDVLAKENVTIEKNLVQKGNTTIGTTCGTKLDVNSESTFNCKTNLLGDTIIGSKCTDKFTVKSESTFECNTNLKSNVTIGTECDSGTKFVNNSQSEFNCLSTFNESVDVKKVLTIGTSCGTDVGLVVKSQSEFDCLATFNKKAIFNEGMDVSGDVNLGSTCTKNKVTILSPFEANCSITGKGKLTINGSSVLIGNVTIGNTANQSSLIVQKEITSMGNINVGGDLLAKNKESSTIIESKIIELGSSEKGTESIMINSNSNFNQPSMFNKIAYFYEGIDIGNSEIRYSEIDNKERLLISTDMLDVQFNGSTFSDFRINKTGVKFPRVQQTENSVGEEATIVYNNSIKRFQYKDDERWNDIGSTKYIDHKFKVADWKEHSEGYSIDIPNPENFKVLTITMYEFKKGYLRKVEADVSGIFKNKIQVMIGLREEMPFNGRVIAILANDIEDFQGLEEFMLPDPTVVTYKAGTDSFTLGSNNPDAFYMVGDDTTHYKLASGSGTGTALPLTQLSKPLDADTDIRFYGMESFNWSLGAINLKELGEDITFLRLSSVSEPLTVEASLPPLLTSLNSCFAHSYAKITGVENWDTSNITTMDNICNSCTVIPKIENWDVSNVTSLVSAFDYSRPSPKYTLNLSKWDVSKVTNLNNFMKASRNLDIIANTWNTSSIITMNGTFMDCSYTPDVTAWDVSNVTSMTETFYRNGNFNQDISNWNVSKVLNMVRMFSTSKLFTGEFIVNWKLDSLIEASHMFEGSVIFNADMSKLNFTNVKDKSFMFAKCPEFNGNISTWDMSKTESIESMFEGCSKFNQDLSTWIVTNIVNMANTFKSCLIFNQDISSWIVNNVSNMNGMFENASSFVQNLHLWKVPLIETKPENFDANTSVVWDESMKPQWGVA